MNEDELTYECQVCFIAYNKSKIIAIERIEYSRWLICMQCADKISDALLVKVVTDLNEKSEGKNE